jgi:hypothetical protein
VEGQTDLLEQLLVLGDELSVVHLEFNAIYEIGGYSDDEFLLRQRSKGHPFDLVGFDITVGLNVQLLQQDIRRASVGS